MTTDEELLEIPGFLRKGGGSTAPADGPETGGSDLPEHSPLAPSSAHQWFECPGSVALVQALTESGTIDPDDGSDWAALGGAAHALGYRCLRDGTDAWEHTNDAIEIQGQEFVVDDEMTAAVQVYLDEVRVKVAELDPEFFEPELRYHAYELHKHCFGTSDAPIVGAETLAVVDYKHGEGIVVDVEWNAQLLCYAAGVVTEFARDDRLPDTLQYVELVIVQPRAHHPDGPVRRWTLTLDDLGEWVAATLLPRIKATEEPDAPLKTGDHCRFCAAKVHCPAQRALVTETDTDAKPNTMSDTELAETLSRLENLTIYIKALQDEVFARLMKGSDVPGYKLVRKQANRTWKEGAKVEEKFGEDAWTKKLISPAQAERLRGGKKFVAQNAFKPDTGLTVALEEDKRPAVKAKSAADAFDGVED